MPFQKFPSDFGSVINGQRRAEPVLTIYENYEFLGEHVHLSSLARTFAVPSHKHWF